MKLWKFRLILSMASFMLLIIILGSSSTITPAYTQDKPTPTPSTTPVAEIILPDWVHDPIANILILETHENFDTDTVFSLINIATNEIFSLDYPEIHDVRWVKSDDGLYLVLRRRNPGEPKSFSEYIDVATGQLTRYASDDVDMPREQTMSNLKQGNGQGLAFELVAETNFNEIDTGHYQSDTTIQLIFHNSDEDRHRLLTSFPPDTQDIAVQWVGGGQYLGVSKSYFREGNLITDINIYDDNGDVVASSWTQSGIDSIAWSPTEHPYFLYRAPGEVPDVCLAEAGERRANCDWFADWEIENDAQITQYTWSADGSRIIVVYRNADEMRGGLCLFELATGNVECPLAKEITDGHFAGSYIYNAPNQYGVFHYTSSFGDSYQTDATYQSGICYLDQETYAIACLAEDTIPADSYYRAAIPAPAGETLVLIYQDYVSTNYDEGLCLLNMNTLGVHCPVEPVDLVGLYISTYTWSPDHRYFVFMFNAAGPGGHDVSNTRYGIVDTASGIYHYGGFAHLEHHLDESWRPAISN